VELDRTDYALLRLLQQDARLSNKQLAAGVGLAQSTCHERLRRLWSAGVLTGTRASVDPASLGYHVAAFFMIEISRHERRTIDSLLDELQRIPEVQGAYLITGRYDLMVRVLARDVDHLKTLAYEHFTHRPVISRFETSIIYEGREGRGTPVPDQAGQSEPSV
jgi:DNA-binding Lrp family transcriptional regulator